MAKKLQKQRRFRLGVQTIATFLQNGNGNGWLTGRIYKGPLKQLCVPGLNCYSCPGAFGSCPIGAMQAVATTPDYSLSLLVLGFLTLTGAVLGRVVCGFLCPFGWVQDLLHKLPVRKRSTRPYRKLTWVKYGVLVLFVFLLPLVPINALGMGDATFCKYICPQGVLEAGIPLSAMNAPIREGLGALFYGKLAILLGVVGLSATFFRPFCKWLCPLGAIYALFNRFSLYRLGLDGGKCTQCGACEAVCSMDCAPQKDANSPECIRCGECVAVCPEDALCKGFCKKNATVSGG